MWVMSAYTYNYVIVRATKRLVLSAYTNDPTLRAIISSVS